MDSAPPPSSPDVEISTPLLVSREEEKINQGLESGCNSANRRNFNQRGLLNEGEQSAICFGMALMLWIYASVIVLVIYGPETVSLGPNSSILFETNSILVKSVKVKEVDFSKSAGLQLFGFDRSPPLDVFVNWSESRLLSISHQSHKTRPYYLNKGTSLNISYTVKPQGCAVQLAVRGGPESMITYPWSWNLIQGSGMIEVDISETSTYYVSLTNLKRKDVEVELNIDVRAVFYDTKGSVYNCTINNSECTFNAISLAGNSVVVTSPAPSQRVSIDDEWYIELSYQPRYMAYVIGGGMWICFLLLMLLAIHLCDRIQCCGGERRRTENDSARTRLLANKDENGSSMGSSNESFANDDADVEELTGNVGETSNSNRHSCAICYAATRDCFFLPCGHCVSCYQCGTTTAETDGTCSICRRKIKKVKRVYTV